MDATKPNLSLEPCKGKLVTCNGNLRERYTSLKAMSEARNIPRKVLTLANKENAPGIMQNGIVKCEELLPWLQTNYDRLFLSIKDKYVQSGDTSSLQEEKLKQEVIKLKNFNRARDSAYISRKLVFSTINEIRNKWADLIKQKLEFEMPARCKKMDEVELRIYGKSLCDELLHKFATPISQWGKPVPDKEEQEEELNESGE